MNQRVLLVLNCAADASYGNRELLATLYRERFDGIAFAVNATCARDPAYQNIVASWSPPADSPEHSPCASFAPADQYATMGALQSSTRRLRCQS